jgi:hypothetical protein
VNGRGRPPSDAARKTLPSPSMQRGRVILRVTLLRGKGATPTRAERTATRHAEYLVRHSNGRFL